MCQAAGRLIKIKTSLILNSYVWLQHPFKVLHYDLSILLKVVIFPYYLPMPSRPSMQTFPPGFSFLSQA